MKRSGTARFDSGNQILHRLFIGDRFTGEEEINMFVENNYAQAIARKHLIYAVLRGLTGLMHLAATHRTGTVQDDTQIQSRACERVVGYYWRRNANKHVDSLFSISFELRSFGKEFDLWRYVSHTTPLFQLR